MTRRPSHGGARPGSGAPITTGRGAGAQRVVRLSAAEDRTIGDAAATAGVSPAEVLRSTTLRVLTDATAAGLAPAAYLDAALSPSRRLEAWARTHDDDAPEHVAEEWRALAAELRERAGEADRTEARLLIDQAQRAEEIAAALERAAR